MIRNIIITFVFFFAPALLMFVLRNLFLYWQARHHIRKHHPDIIDITPSNNPTSPSRFFIASAITIGLLSAYLVYTQLTTDKHDIQRQYVPAHIDAQGSLVPAHRSHRSDP